MLALCIGLIACGDSGGSGTSADGGITAEPDAAMEMECVIDGTYAALLVPLTGNCGPVNDSFTVELSPNLIRTLQEMQFDRMITTQVVVKACSIQMTREVSVQGVLEQQLSADELELQAGGNLAGDATYRRFGADQTVLCEGTYEMTLAPRNL